MPGSLSLQFSVDWPPSLLGWLGWFGMLVLIGAGAYYWRSAPHKGPQGMRGWLLILLLALAPLTALFLGLRLPGSSTAALAPDALAEPGKPPLMMFLVAVPWVLAGGFIGPLAAVGVALVSGLCLALFDTHSLFTPLEVAGMALLFAGMVRQRYRTPFYRLLRHPLAASLLLSILYAPVFVLSAFFATNGSLAVRMDYALTQTWMLMLARAGELLIAGFAAEILAQIWPRAWGGQGALVPSPSETSLQLRFFYVTAPLVLVLVLVLTVGDWVVAGNAARQMVRERLTSTASVAAESLPYFLETGQNLILNQASVDLLDLSGEGLDAELARRLRAVPYFRQLVLLDAGSKVLGGYPSRDLDALHLTLEEKTGLQLAFKGAMIQTYTVPPLPGETTAQISFLAVVKNKEGKPGAVLLGRTDLSANPFTQSAIQALKSMSELGGEGMILDESGRILYHPLPAQIMQSYTGSLPVDTDFFDDTSRTGTRLLVHYHKVIGRPWLVVLTMPAQKAQQLALDIAIPLLFLLLAIGGTAIVALRLGLRTVTASLKTMAEEASHIAQGKFDRPLVVPPGVDEVGRLGMAFERMRLSLKARMDELSRLLMVSQGVASNLEMEQAALPVLKAAVGGGAALARLVLIKEVAFETGQHPAIAFGYGPAANAYAFLDDQLFEMMRHQELVSVPNTSRVRMLTFPPGAPTLGAVLALALRHENNYYGVLWVGYDQPTTFSEEEVRFLTTLAGEAALAASNARLYTSSEVGRQRLEAVLDSTPEPVLVIDELDRLLLLNPAAVQVPGLIASAMPGRPINEVVAQAQLLELIRSPLEEKMTSREISLPNGRVYYATISPVLTENRPVGRICMLRDITHYKELDALKSDFVSTVSHDLRSPLTLIRGYTTMLQMVGELNDQQKSYVRKIITGVENITRLVNNLLDLGRIETGIGLQIEALSLVDVVERVVNGLQPQASQKNIQIMMFLDKIQNLTVPADPALLEQAVFNLLENAIKYTSLGGQVKIAGQLKPASVILEFHDSGIGIAPIDLPHLFEKFYRSGRREVYQLRGTGLGLAIVKSIAERHGGKVWVDSQLGKGSTFYLEIPLQQPA